MILVVNQNQLFVKVAWTRIAKYKSHQQTSFVTWWDLNFILTRCLPVHHNRLMRYLFQRFYSFVICAFGFEFVRYNALA